MQRKTPKPEPKTLQEEIDEANLQAQELIQKAKASQEEAEKNELRQAGEHFTNENWKEVYRKYQEEQDANYAPKINTKLPKSNPEIPEERMKQYKLNQERVKKRAEQQEKEFKTSQLEKAGKAFTDENWKEVYRKYQEEQDANYVAEVQKAKEEKMK